MLIYYGDEDQNDMMKLIKDYKGEDDMTENRIAEIENDIQNYEKAINDAENALAQAERELTAELERRVETGEIKLSE